MSETVNWNVDSETGSFVSMGSDAEISGLNNGSGDPLGAAPKCLELEETTETPEASEMCNFDFMLWTADRSPSLAWERAPSMRRRLLEGENPPCAGLSGYMGSKSRETNLEASTLTR